MTHIENIPHILQYGITHQISRNSNKNYVPIGDSNLIFNRENLVLPNGIKLGRYIPFYYNTCMPMLFVIKNGFNGVKLLPQQDIVYCITDIEQIKKHQLQFVFSNGHAVNSLTEFFESSEVDNIHDLLDKTAIFAKYWKDERDLDLKRRKEAEFLVANDIPITAILSYAVYDIDVKQKLIALGIEESKVIIKRDYYF